MNQGRKLLYVELKSGYSDNGPAWIGFGTFSRTGGSIYFDGKVLKRATGVAGNRYDLRTGEEYWVSGVKKRGSNRHPLGGGVILMDRSAIDEYLRTTGTTILPERMFSVVDLINEPNKAFAYEMENKDSSRGFDHSLRSKALRDLSVEQLQALLEYYEGVDMNTLPKKARKQWIQSLHDVQQEVEVRNAQLKTP